MGVRLVDGVLISDDGSASVGIEVEEVDETVVRDIDDAPRCEDCGTILHYAGRGRKPKWCEEHRPTAPKRSTAPSRSGAIKNEAALRDALLTRYMQIGNLLSFLHPAYGMGVKQKAEEAVNADIEYARVSPAFRRTLEAGLEKSALGAVIAVHASMLAPVVVGERAKAARRKATRSATTESNAAPKRGEAATPPRQAPPRPPVRDDSSVIYGDFPSTESDVAPESINAAAMPGMPG